MRSRPAAALQQLPVLARPRRRRVRVVKLAAPRADMPRKPRPSRSPRILTMTMRLVPRRSMEETRVPYLRMSGRWLAEHGFGIGGPVYVTVEQGRVILTNTPPPIGENSAELVRSEAGVNGRTSLSSDHPALESDRGSLFSHPEDSESDRRSL